MSKPFRTTRRVEFRHTDAAGIAHFTAFFGYMEEVEHEFLRSIGLSVMRHDSRGAVSWPRVSAQCDYTGAVRFEDVVDVELTVVRLGAKSITYGFAFSHEGRNVAQGRITCVCCRLSSAEHPTAIQVPAEISHLLSEYSPGPEGDPAAGDASRR